MIEGGRFTPEGAQNFQSSKNDPETPNGQPLEANASGEIETRENEEYQSTLNEVLKAFLQLIEFFQKKGFSKAARFLTVSLVRFIKNVSGQ